MKRIVLALTFLLATSSAASAQFTPSTENLRGLPGVRLIVMFHGATRVEAFDEVKRPGVLRTLEDDTKAKLQEAGIPFSKTKYADDKAPLVVLIKLDRPGLAYPVETEVKLVQRVQIMREPPIETGAVTWSSYGVGNNPEISTIQSVLGNLIDQFIRDYRSVNPRQSTWSGKDKPGDTNVSPCDGGLDHSRGSMLEADLDYPYTLSLTLGPVARPLATSEL